MKTEILTLESKEDALINLKAQLCRPEIAIVHCSYFYDQIDEKHKVILCCYY